MSLVRVTWRVEGMHCPHCETAVEQAVAPLAGLESPRASYRRGTLTARWDAEALPRERVAAALSEAGYALADGQRRAPLGQLMRTAALLAGLAALYGLLACTRAADWLAAFPVARAGMSLGMIFGVGLLTSMHCVAMCGGICIAQSAGAAQRGGRPGRAALLYNLGRVASYTAVGALVGALGGVFELSAYAKAAIQVAAAVFMLIMALNLAGGFAWLKRLSISMPRGLSERVTRVCAGRSALIVGLANGLMPCGPLQSMQLYALSTGSWWMGALSMLCFGLGTAPLMLGIGLAGSRLNRRFAGPMRRASALLVALMGLSMLISGLALAGIGMEQTPMGADGYAVIQGERQYVRSGVDYGAYTPITVQRGVPVEWTIVADADRLNGCNNEIVVPAYGLTVALQPGENVVEFTPGESGAVTYSCWMGMIRSSIYVVDSLEDVAN